MFSETSWKSNDIIIDTFIWVVLTAVLQEAVIMRIY